MFTISNESEGMPQMTCCKCKKDIPDESAFCLHCGAPQRQKALKKYEYKRVYFTHNGKQYSARGKTLKEAHAKAAQMEQELKQGEQTSGGNIPVSKWADEWLATYKEHMVGEGQYYNYSLYIGIITKAIGAKRVADVTDADLQKILNKRAGYSKSDVKRLRMTVKAIFSQARKSRMIVFDPSENLVMPSAKDGSRRSVSQAERELILKTSETHHAGLWVCTMLYAGLRPGECRALDWRHIDLDNRRIYVKLAMKAKTTRIDEPKTEAGARVIPINDKLYPLLASAEGDDSQPVFLQPLGQKRHTKASMEGMWRNFCRTMDIANGAEVYRSEIIKSTLAPDLVPYCLRHTYGTDLQDAEVPINVARYLMGHTDISVTANIYTDTTDHAIQDAADKINAHFGQEENVKNGKINDKI